jgi:hypothetical protein
MSEEEIERMINGIDDIFVEELDIEKIIDENKVVDEKIEKWQENRNNFVVPNPNDEKSFVMHQLQEITVDIEAKGEQVVKAIDITICNLETLPTLLRDNIRYLEEYRNLLMRLNHNEKVLDYVNNLKNISQKNAEMVSVIGDNENILFSAIELMQFNDLNRQKIQRVISTLLQIQEYINKLFQYNQKDTLVVAKHIHGDDDSDSLSGDDLEELIRENQLNQ